MAFRAVWSVDWLATARRVWDEVRLDDCFGAAAQIAFYFMLGFFPLVIFLAALATTFAALPTGDVERNVMGLLANVMPREAFVLVQDNVSQLLRTLEFANLRLLFVSALLALWPASGGMRAVIVTLNRAYNVREGRGPWRLYGVSVAITIALCLTALVGLPVLSFASSFRDQILGSSGPGWATVWHLGGRFLALAALVFGIEFIYHVAPNARRPWHWVTAGSIVAVLVWIVATWGFSKYVSRFGRYDAVYAGLAAPIVLLLWFYITGLAILIGGEINAEIERQSGIMARPVVPAPLNVDAAGHDTTLHDRPLEPGKHDAPTPPVSQLSSERDLR